MSFTAQNGVSPLFMASQNGHAEVVNTLLKSGADPNMVVGTLYLVHSAYVTKYSYVK